MTTDAPAPFRITRSSETSRRTPGNESATRNMLNLLSERTSSRQRYRGNTPRTPSQYNSQRTQEDLAKHKQALEITKQISRRWKTGDVYAPHDLSAAEMRKWKQRGVPRDDVVDVLGLKPVEEYKVSLQKERAGKRKGTRR